MSTPTFHDLHAHGCNCNQCHKVTLVSIHAPAINTLLLLTQLSLLLHLHTLEALTLAASKALPLGSATAALHWARLAVPERICIMITYVGRCLGVWKAWHLHMKRSRKSCHLVLASRSFVIKQVSCHLVLASRCLLLRQVLLSGSLGFQSWHVIIRHGTIHTAQSTASHNISQHDGQVWSCLHIRFNSQGCQAGRCAVAASAAMESSAYRCVAWHADIRKFAVTVKHKNNKHQTQFDTEEEAVQYLV